MNETNPGRRNWQWIPSLYFAQGVPYVAVMTLSVVMYKRLGISNTDIALYTSLLNLPWVLKPLWSPVVDLFKTKRQWILSMQFLISIALAAVGGVVQSNLFFGLSLAVFWLMAFSSATHDIAADGFYMLSLSKHDQSWWVGVRSTFFRLAMIVGSGIMIVFAGWLETKNGLEPVEIKVQTCAETADPMFSPESARDLFREQDSNSCRLVVFLGTNSVQPADTLKISGSALPGQVRSVIEQARQWNREHGFTPQPKESQLAGTGSTKTFWQEYVSEPLAGFLRRHFPKNDSPRPQTSGGIGIVYFALSKQPSREVPVNIARRPRGLESIGLGSSDQGFKLVEGERLVFTPENWNQPAAAVIQFDSRNSALPPLGASATFVTRAGNIPLAWSLTLLCLSGLFLCFCMWHTLVLPRPDSDGPVRAGNKIAAEFIRTLTSFFRKPGIIPALSFILLYRFAEAQSVKLLTPFLLDARETGGLGLTTSQVGLAYGTIGIAALTAGGLLGGFLGAKFGLKKMLPVMVCAIHLPNFALVYLSFAQPENIATINACVAVEQFGYGFGFTAYMLYMLYFSDGEHRTAHYAICTGLMALGMMIPGLFSGWLQEAIGYRQFFIWVMLATIPGFLVAFTVKIEPSFGKKTTEHV